MGATTIIDIPLAQAYSHNDSDCVLNTALHVVTTEPISLYASNFQAYTFDVTDILPTPSLGSNYIIQTYNEAARGVTMVPGFKTINGRHDSSSSEFSVLAVEDFTTVYFMLTCDSQNGHYAYQPFSVTLNAGQCYQLQSFGGDFSGSQVSVSGNKRVAVFAGNLCTNVPYGCAYCDHIVEQMMPVSCWGNHFVVTNSSMRYYDIVRVTAANNGCQISINGSPVTTINQRETYQFQITDDDPSMYLETSEPAMVYLYYAGSECAGQMGDPSMVMISPIEQRMDYVTFSTFNSGASQYHYVNVVTNTEDVSMVQLDGNSIAEEFSTVSGNTGYSFARVAIEHGSHTLSTTGAGFVAHVYGLGDDESYAYSVGSNAVQALYTNLLVNGHTASDEMNICDETVNFDLNYNYDVSQVNWTFGDGQTGSGIPITHQYPGLGDYEVSCDVYKLDMNGQDSLVVSFTTELHIHDAYYTEFEATAHNSYTWEWMGETYTESGDYSYEGQTIYGCDSIVTLHLTIYHEITATAYPTEAGTVTGGGQYNQNETCTLTATANAGYNFMCWTDETGAVVSTNSEYSFTVTEDQTLTACFATEGYCGVKFDFYDSYGDGWNGNTLVITFDDGTVQQLTLSSGSYATYILPIADGSHVTLSWIVGSWIGECSYTVSYLNGNEIFYGYNMSGDFVFVFDMDCEGMPVTPYCDIYASPNLYEGGSVNGGGTYRLGQTCTLSASTNEGYEFINWTKDDEIVSTELSFSFIVTESGTYVANFEAIPYQVTVTANPTEGGTVTGGGTYTYGQTCTLTATANEGYVFMYWTDETGLIVTTGPEYSFTVTGERTFMAKFAEEGSLCDITFDLYDSYGDGWNGNYLVVNYADGTFQQITLPSGSYASYIIPFVDGSPVTLSWITGSWVGECSFLVSYSNGNRICYGQNLNNSFMYDFDVDCDGMPVGAFDITVWINPEEGGTTTGTGIYNYGETCTLTASDNWGYHFLNWTKDGEVVSTTRDYSFVVTEGGDYVANFGEGGYTVEVTANPNEGGFVEGIGEYYYGEYCELVATANEGYTFISWTEDGEVVSTNTYYGFTVTESRNLVANFTEGIVVYDGDATNGYVPVYGYYTDAYLKCETVYPSEALTTLSGGTVSAMRFFANQSNVSWGNAYFKVFLKEVEDASISDFSGTDDATIVYEGPLSIVDGLMDVVFNTPFSYNGGNLLVGVYNMVQGSYVSSPWYGQTVDGASVQGYSYNGLDAITPTQRNFIPKTMFFYSAGSTPTYTITVTANPSEGGTVSGGGIYAEGETCTLAATANEGYAFVNWTKGEVEVSTDPTYTFTVTEAGDYVANFTLDNGYHWDVNVSTYPNTLTMVGVIEINNVEQMTTTLEVGAFCGSECRGRERAVNDYFDMFGHYFVFLTVYGNDNDQINFRLYDHAIGEELDLTCSPLVFQTNGLFGNPGAPYVFDFSMSQITQSTDITLGWNWWSTYVEADDLFDQLKTGLGANASQIKSSTSFVNYFSGMWIGGLNSINNESCYLINANNACTLEMTGDQAMPANHPITINPNWNWIGYPNMGAQSVLNAFSNFTPTNGDQVKSQNSFSTYYSGMWVGGLSTITPGMGLLYKSNSTGVMTLIYPEPNRSEEVVENVTNEDNHWTADYHAYPSNMTVMAVVELDDVELSGEHYELAAFAEGECRGSARLMYVAPIQRYVAFLTVVGDEASELRFSLYDDETGTVETQSIASLQYETNAIVGSLETPYVIRFRSTTDVDEWASSVNVFPNPVNCGEQFSLGLPAVETLRATSVQIVNALGVVVETLRATSVPAHITAPKVAGVYTLRITVEGKGTCFRKLVVE